MARTQTAVHEPGNIFEHQESTFRRHFRFTIGSDQAGLHLEAGVDCFWGEQSPGKEPLNPFHGPAAAVQPAPVAGYCPAALRCLHFQQAAAHPRAAPQRTQMSSQRAQSKAVDSARRIRWCGYEAASAPAGFEQETAAGGGGRVFDGKPFPAREGLHSVRQVGQDDTLTFPVGPYDRLGAIDLQGEALGPVTGRRRRIQLKTEQSRCYLAAMKLRLALQLE